jgi:hypothetical protein
VLNGARTSATSVWRAASTPYVVSMAYTSLVLTLGQSFRVQGSGIRVQGSV